MAEFPAYKTIKTADLIPYARNSRTHSDAQVAKLAAIAGVGCAGDNLLCFQPLQSIGQDAGGDALVRIHQLLEVGTAPKQHVANDQQRPAVSERTQGEANGALIGFIDHRLYIRASD